MAIFYAAASMLGAFSGLVAYAIEQMDGVSGLAGWKWIFILEGLAPIAVSLVLYFLLPDKPETARFVSPKERKFVIERMSMQGAARTMNDDKINISHIRAGFSDWRVWLAIVPFWGCSIGTYGFTATVPTVVRDTGYSPAHAQLMTIPIYVAALVATVIVAFWSDHIKQRTPFLMGGFAVAAAGFIGELATPHDRLPGVTYFFLFLIAIGLYCPFTCIVTLVADNLAPSSKRAVGMAVLISVGNLGGVCGSNIYFKAEAPRYPNGFGVCLAFQCSPLYQLTLFASHTNARTRGETKESRNWGKRLLKGTTVSRSYWNWAIRVHYFGTRCDASVGYQHPVLVAGYGRKC